MIHCYPIPLDEFDDRCRDALRFTIETNLATEGIHLLLRFNSDSDRVAAAMIFSEAAKSFGRGLLVCADTDDEQIEEHLKYLREDLSLRVRGYRFIWIQSHKKFEMAVMRALMPLPAVKDPRSVWESLP